MILQNTFDWTDFISKIIGSFIATLFTILAWFILNYLKRKKKKNLEKLNIKRIYFYFRSFDAVRIISKIR